MCNYLTASGFLNSNLNEHKAIDFAGNREELSSALLIDIANPYSPLNTNKQRVYSEGGTIGMPLGCIVGIREFYHFNGNWNVIKITEFHPELGRTWYNNYDVVKNSWSGWVER